MRTLLPLLLVACTHALPPPAPVAVPPEAAAGPARAAPPAPDAGTDAGTATPDAGPADGGAPRASLQDEGDLVSPVTAAGAETPAGLDWGPRGENPAAQLFKNVKLLGDLTGNRFMAGMQSMRANLGQKCLLCHAVPDDFPSDARPAKVRARAMIRMNRDINHKTFAGKVRVTCWTCHRGEAKPVQDQTWSKDLPAPLAKLSAADLARPAEKVFKDVRELGGMDARQFALIMGWFTRELGVKCTHCHAEKDFAATTPKKTRAREMLAMAGSIARDFYGGNDSPVGCGTCHRGSPLPARTPHDPPPLGGPDPLTAPPGRAN
jgi:hypothetical protein